MQIKFNFKKEKSKFDLASSSLIRALKAEQETKRTNKKVEQINRRSRVCHRKIANIIKHRLKMMPIFVNHPGAADIKIQPKSPKFLLDMRYFCNFSLVSVRNRPRSRRCAERTRQGEGRWSRPPKAALERTYSTENSSFANRILGPRQKRSRDQIIPETKECFLCIYELNVRCHPNIENPTPKKHLSGPAYGWRDGEAIRWVRWWWLEYVPLMSEFFR